MKARALVFFTVLMQAAVGLMWILGTATITRDLLHLWRGPALPGILDLPVPVVGAVGVLALPALGFSLFHLGQPVRAYRALANLRSSWLSREILFGLLFVVFWAASWLALWARDGSSLSAWLNIMLAFLAASAGLGLAISMVNVYRLPAAYGWDGWSTALEFVRTIFVLGFASAALTFSLAALGAEGVQQFGLSASAVLAMGFGCLLEGFLQWAGWLEHLYLLWRKQAGSAPLTWAASLLVLILAEVGLIVLVAREELMFYPDLLAATSGLVFILLLGVELSLRARFYRSRQPVL